MLFSALIDDERIINLQRAKVHVFSDSVLCLGKIHQNPDANEAWKKRIEWITTSQSHKDYDGINGESTEFEWNNFPGFTTLQLHGKVKDLLSRLGETPENFRKCRIQLCIPAMHDTFQFGVIVLSSYDEYTTVVKSGNVASKHVNG